MHSFLIEHTTGPRFDVAPSVVALRDAFAGATRDLLAVADGALEKPWPWLRDEDDADVRYGFYRCFEAIEEATGLVGRALEEARVERSPGSRLIAPATVARWELHALLAPLDDDLLDSDPGGSEWTIRQTLGHIVSTQRAYGWFTAWWHGRAAEPEFPIRVPEDVVEASGLPDESAEGEGGIDDIRRRLDEILDISAARLAPYGDEDLAIRARWSGLPVTIGFRLGRWSSHIAEHTVQVDKTLAMIGRQPREVERLIRLLGRAYGRLDGAVFGLPADVIERSGGKRAAGGVIRDLAAELGSTAQSVRIAAARDPDTR